MARRRSLGPGELQLDGDAAGLDEEQVLQSVAFAKSKRVAPARGRRDEEIDQLEREEGCSSS